MAKILTEARTSQGLPTAHHFAIEGNLWESPLSSPMHTVAAAADHFLVRARGFSSPISLARDRVGSPVNLDLENWDVLHLHGINGLVKLDELAARLPDKRIIWTLHDMNPMTGVCHYSLGCTGFTAGCGSCPAVRKPFHPAVEKSLTRKISAVSSFSKLSVVAPSDWLAKMASFSQVFQSHPVTLIPNPISTIFCEPPKSQAPPRFTFLVVAQNLSDPVKNVGMAVEAFQRLRETHPQVTLALVGSNADHFRGKGISILGPLSPIDLRQTMADSLALLVPSHAENSPLVIAEAAAQGLVPIVNDVGGMPQMVEALGAGGVFSSPATLEDELVKIIERNQTTVSQNRKTVSQRSLELYSPSSVSQQYDELYGY